MDRTGDRYPSRFHEGVRERLVRAGIAPETAEALLAFDSGVFFWKRMAARDEVPGRLIEELGLDLELSQFSSLTAITRIQNGIGRKVAQPATIGLLAEEMNIDPSRASRIATGLIARGYLRREAAQDDGRKSILVLTDKAVSAFQAFRDLKWDKMLQTFAGWSDADIVAFSGLFSRYCQDLRRVYHQDGQAADRKRSVE